MRQHYQRRQAEQSNDEGAEIHGAGTSTLLVEGVEAELAHLGDAAYAVESYRPLSIHRPGDRIFCRFGDTVVEGTFVGFAAACTCGWKPPPAASRHGSWR